MKDLFLWDAVGRRVSLLFTYITSSLFAFVKVAQPTDTFGRPSFKVSVRTSGTAGIKPIDSLQIKFDRLHDCSSLGTRASDDLSHLFLVYPNPSLDQLSVYNKTAEPYQLMLLDASGRLVHEAVLTTAVKMDVSKYKRGMYLLKISKGNKTCRQEGYYWVIVIHEGAHFYRSYRF